MFPRLIAAGKKGLTFTLDRLKERNTWVGIIGLLTSLGIGISPDLASAIAIVGSSAASALLVMTKG